MGAIIIPVPQTIFSISWGTEFSLTPRIVTNTFFSNAVISTANANLFIVMFTIISCSKCV